MSVGVEARLPEGTFEPWMAEAASWLDVLRTHRRWVVVAHVTPDGDTAGCALAMAALLRALGGRVEVVCPDPFPQQYRFLAGADEVLIDRLPEDVQDVGVVTVDFTDWGRVCTLADRLRELHPIVVVDHHISNQRFGDHNLVVPSAAATGEVVFALFQHFGVPLGKDAAEALYTAIVTDTGRFSYGATGAHTHRIAAHLIDCGVVPQCVNQQIFEQTSVAQMRLKSAAIERMHLEFGGKVAWTIITRRMLAEYGATEEDCDGIAERLRSLAGVDTSFYLREQEDGRYKVSLRSKGAVDVNRLASHFGGGGHLRAAGCTIEAPAGDLGGVVTQLLALMAPEVQGADS